METIKNFVKAAAVRAVILSISVFYVSLVVVAILVKWVIKGNKYWEIKERTLPPLILQDAKWGRHSFVNLKDVKIHYVENGDRSKPLMLLVHGFPEFWFSWRHQLNHFAKDYWVVALDLRGYSDSDKPSKTSAYKVDIIEKDIVDFVKALQKDKCILVGHDWGGVISFYVASHYPEIVEKLIIMNAPHPLAFRKKLMSSIKQFIKSWYIFAFQLPYLPELYFHTEDLEVFRDMFENRMTEEELEAYKYIWSRPGAWTPPINYYRMSLNGHDLLNPVKMPKIEKPTLIVWGENDIALAKDLPELTKRYIPDLTVNYIPNGNHFIQTDKPVEVNAFMDKFLKQRK